MVKIRKTVTACFQLYRARKYKPKKKIPIKINPRPNEIINMSICVIWTIDSMDPLHEIQLPTPPLHSDIL